MTEPVTPLAAELKDSDKSASVKVNLLWGLYNVALALRFLNEQANVVHGNIRIGSIFVSQSGEWKLGGLEVMSSLAAGSTDAALSSITSISKDSGKYMPPEIMSRGWTVIKSGIPTWSMDSWMYALLLMEVFNGHIGDITQAGQVPLPLFKQCKNLLSADPKLRSPLSKLLDAGTASGSFFDNELIQIALFLENVTVKDNSEKIAFFKRLPDLLPLLPAPFAKYKILPVLMNALEFGSAGPKILPMILKIGSDHLKDAEYSSVVALIMRLFSSPDV